MVPGGLRSLQRILLLGSMASPGKGDRSRSDNVTRSINGCSKKVVTFRNVGTYDNISMGLATGPGRGAKVIAPGQRLLRIFLHRVFFIEYSVPSRGRTRRGARSVCLRGEKRSGCSLERRRSVQAAPTTRHVEMRSESGEGGKLEVGCGSGGWCKKSCVKGGAGVSRCEFNENKHHTRRYTHESEQRPRY
jgi:hypothetical protein